MIAAIQAIPAVIAGHIQNSGSNGQGSDIAATTATTPQPASAAMAGAASVLLLLRSQRPLAIG